MVVLQGRVNVPEALILRNSVAEESTDSQLPLSRVKVSVIVFVLELMLTEVDLCSSQSSAILLTM